MFIIADILPFSVFTATAVGSPSPCQCVNCALYTMPNSPVLDSRQLCMHMYCNLCLQHNYMETLQGVLNFYVSVFVSESVCVRIYACMCACVYVCTSVCVHTVESGYQAHIVI